MAFQIYALDAVWLSMTIAAFLLFVSKTIFQKVGLENLYTSLNSFGKTRRARFLTQKYHFTYVL